MIYNWITGNLNMYINKCTYFVQWYIDYVVLHNPLPGLLQNIYCEFYETINT
jgi:hypothetical protein